MGQQPDEGFRIKASPEATEQYVCDNHHLDDLESSQTGLLFSVFQYPYFFLDLEPS